MDRKWRFNRGAVETVLSISDFKAQIPPCDAPNTLVTPTDLYAMYTLLHIERKEWQLRWSPEGKFYYYLVQWQAPVLTEPPKPLPAAPSQASLPETNDDDMEAGVPAEGRFARADSDDDEDPSTAGPPADPQQQPDGTTDTAFVPTQYYTRTQIVVPVSSSTQELTPKLLHRLFSVKGVQAQQLILALIDCNGVPTQNCLYNYIQSPLEGPGMADLELLDD